MNRRKKINNLIREKVSVMPRPESGCNGSMYEKKHFHKFLVLMFFIFLFFNSIYAQDKKAQQKGKEDAGQAKDVQITGGESLEQKEIDGVRYRELIGAIVITQGDLKITCRQANQYYEKNEFELIGDVVATQDTITIKTPRAYYYGDTRIVYSEWKLELNDSHYTLKADRGYYFSNEKKADFYQNVRLFDKVTYIASDSLNYFRNENKAIAVGSVMVSDTSSVLFTDTLFHFREKRFSQGFGHVKMFNPGNKTVILSGRFENNDSTGYSLITMKPLFVQVDSTSDGKLDTLYISSKKMEAYQDSTDRFTAIDSVKIFRNNFSAVNNLTTLFRKKNRIFTHKLESDLTPPVLWYEKSQLFGDSVYITMEKKKLKYIEVIQNAFMLSQNEDKEYRFDQMSGKKLLMNFTDGEIKRLDIDGALLSIYYLYDNKEPNGLVKASSERGNMYFKEKKVDDVKLYGSVGSDYHPENIILGKEKDYTLPGFVIFKNKPRKEEFFSKEVDEALIKLDEIIKNKNGKYPYLKRREPKKSI